MKCLNSVEDDTNSLLKCINYDDQDDMNSLLKLPSPVKCINSDEDDMDCMFKTPSPVKCTDPTTPSSHPIRILPRKLVIVPSKRKPLPVIVQSIGIHGDDAQETACRPTKQDLIHNLYIADTNEVEVEEQLKLLQGLASEWIYEKLESSGDSLIGLNRILSPEAMHRRLSEAI
ncbi:hypothetical protein SASPL_112792 [Salvia splendens]|uniref:Uncharacterized protein n=1 Tax=Salvia splendens TaxID=180675 RepID=A0A8X8YEJ4_SALSN|nr:hypothetical protein SASPL_112792 [Salvia splendens]